MTPEENNYVKSLKDRSDIFNYVVDHLLRQGRRSVVDDTESKYCAYRGPDGDMCAVGCLIADDEYNPSFEGENIDSIITYDDFFTKGIKITAFKDRFVDHQDMLSDLQNFHDNHLFFNGYGLSDNSANYIDKLRKKWNIGQHVYTNSQKRI